MRQKFTFPHCKKKWLFLLLKPIQTVGVKKSKLTSLAILPAFTKNLVIAKIVTIYINYCFVLQIIVLKKLWIRILVGGREIVILLILLIFTVEN